MASMRIGLFHEDLELCYHTSVDSSCGMWCDVTFSGDFLETLSEIYSKVPSLLLVYKM